MKLVPMLIMSDYVEGLFSQINADNRCRFHGNGLQ